MAATTTAAPPEAEAEVTPVDNKHYDALGVSRNADAREIQKAFRALGKELHPDTHPGDEQRAERFKEATEAYAVLSNPEKRKLYDQYGAAMAEDLAQRVAYSRAVYAEAAARAEARNDSDQDSGESRTSSSERSRDRTRPGGQSPRSGSTAPGRKDSRQGSQSFTHPASRRSGSTSSRGRRSGRSPMQAKIDAQQAAKSAEMLAAMNRPWVFVVTVTGVTTLDVHNRRNAAVNNRMSRAVNTWADELAKRPSTDAERSSVMATRLADMAARQYLVAKQLGNQALVDGAVNYAINSQTQLGQTLRGLKAAGVPDDLVKSIAETALAERAARLVEQGRRMDSPFGRGTSARELADSTRDNAADLGARYQSAQQQQRQKHRPSKARAHSFTKPQAPRQDQGKTHGPQAHKGQQGSARTMRSSTLVGHGPRTPAPNSQQQHAHQRSAR